MLKKAHLLIVIFLPLFLHAATLPFEGGEKIDYDIYYHWGIIWKKAGTGTLSVDEAEYEGKPAYKMNLYGRTLAIADKLMRVRDTLEAYTDMDIRPLYYAKIANEGSYWAKDEVFYSYQGDKNKAYINLKRRKRQDRDSTMYIEEQPYDMLTVFYHLRNLNYGSMKEDTVIRVPILSGRRLITMIVRYKGVSMVKMRNKSTYESYRLNLSFVNDDSFKEDDDPIEVWLSLDEKKVPLKVEGKLPIGSLQAEIRE